MDFLLFSTTFLSHVTAVSLPLSGVLLIITILIDVFKKKVYWSKYALFFAAITIVLLIIQILLTYRLTKDIINIPTQNVTSSEKNNYVGPEK